MVHEPTRGSDDDVWIVRERGELLVHAITTHKKSDAEFLELGHLACECQSLIVSTTVCQLRADKTWGCEGVGGCSTTWKRIQGERSTLS